MIDHLVLRAPSGISGDMLLTGLAVISGAAADELEDLTETIGVPELHGALHIEEVKLDGMRGAKAVVRLPAVETSHGHRHYSEIQELISGSSLTERAKGIAQTAFADLARVEGEIHGLPPARVGFHEVGALDSILDICLAAALFDRIAPRLFVCSPLPLCDGVIHCAHGMLASPAPAALKLLEGVPVYGVDSSGETVTPTGIAILKACGARFGSWPELVIRKSCRVFGGRRLPNLPNGAVFAIGDAWPETLLSPA